MYSNRPCQAQCQQGLLQPIWFIPVQGRCIFFLLKSNLVFFQFVIFFWKKIVLALYMIDKLLCKLPKTWCQKSSVNLSGFFEPDLCQLQSYGMQEALAQIYIFFCSIDLFNDHCGSRQIFPYQRFSICFGWRSRELFVQITTWAPCLALSWHFSS